MVSVVDTLVYAFLSLSHVWMLLAFVMLIVKRHKFRVMPQSAERRFYRGVIAISMIAWTWNGLRPTPTLFEERFGLYLGLRTENAAWRVHTGGYRGQPIIAHSGHTSLAVQFEKARGWVLFHHFPTAPQIGRYAAVQFYVLAGDLKQDGLRLALYSDGKTPHPPDGIAMDEQYRCDNAGTATPWKCYRVPSEAFAHPGGGIIAVAFGKGDGVDAGTFFLDDVRLIANRR